MYCIELGIETAIVTHFEKRSEYMSISCLASSIGLGPAGGSGSEFPNQLMFGSNSTTEAWPSLVCAAAVYTLKRVDEENRGFPYSTMACMVRELG